jgi:ribosomal protein L37E
VSRLRRFLHLERPRSERADEADPSSATAGRFEGVEQPGPSPGPPRSSGADLDRFGAEPPPSLDLVEAGAGARPFTRCMRCGMDHNVLAAECAGCGAGLDTGPQRAFNEELWARRQEEAAGEARAEAERREAQARADAELARARRAMGEAIAREVGERERRRLGAEGPGWGSGTGWEGGLGSGGLDGVPLGLRLLRRLPDWRWQLGALALAVGAVGALLAIGRSGRPGAVLAALVMVAVLVVPPGWRRRRW